MALGKAVGDLLSAKSWNQIYDLFHWSHFPLWVCVLPCVHIPFLRPSTFYTFLLLFSFKGWYCPKFHSWSFTALIPAAFPGKSQLPPLFPTACALTSLYINPKPDSLSWESSTLIQLYVVLLQPNISYVLRYQRSRSKLLLTPIPPPSLFYFQSCEMHLLAHQHYTWELSKTRTSFPLSSYHSQLLNWPERK